MGYDLLNEPWMGIEWPTCLADRLRAVLPDGAAAGHGAGPRGDPRRSTGDNIVWWEPQQFAGGQKLDTFYEPVPGEEQLGFSWHNYCPDVFFESPGRPRRRRRELLRRSAATASEHALEQARRMKPCR